jgi:tetratricopeptide (TPR) repeat protein
MNQGRWLRFGILGASIALVAVIYFLPKGAGVGNSAKPQAEPVSAKGVFSEEAFQKKAKTVLAWNLSTKADSLEKLLTKTINDTLVLDSLVALWDAASSPGMAAGFSQRRAEQTGREKDWTNAAYRYFDAFKNAADSVELAWFVSKSMNAYQKVLDINPKNLDAKVDLGILYAEASPQPMKGITLLREVVTEDPLHENAQANLGFLSMKSGQFDKAIERFSQVLKINSARLDMHVYLGEAYLQKGDKENAIRNFEIFKNLSNDPEMNLQIDSYIKEIRSKE